MRWQAGLRHPFGLALLLTSATLALAMAIVPVLGPLSQRAGWMLALGLVAYLATAVVVARPPCQPLPLPLREVAAVRESIASQLAVWQVSGRRDRPSAFAQLLADTIAQLDHRLLPALEEAVRRNEILGDYLARYDRGELPSPEATVVRRLRKTCARQRDAISACVRQAANAHAALLALSQESDETAMATEAARWTEDLLAVHDALADTLRDRDELDRLVR